MVADGGIGIYADAFAVLLAFTALKCKSAVRLFTESTIRGGMVMERGAIGRYEVRVVGGERISAFVPDSLPPDPPLELDGQFLQSLEAASLALGGLSATSSLIPGKE